MPQDDPRYPAPGVPLDDARPDGDEPAPPERVLPAAARRALAEAEERRRARDAQADAADRPKELNGRKGPEPVRYGDWEKNGLISDF